MAKYTTVTHTTASVAGAGGSLDFEIDIPANSVDIYKVKITPSGGTGTSVFSILKAAARAASDLVYKTQAWDDAVWYDPVEDDGGAYAERNQGFVCRYEDADLALKLYCTIVNNDANARTYDVSIDIAASPFTPSVLGVPDLLVAEAMANGLSIRSTVLARSNNDTIDKADFRAICVELGDPLPDFEDLRIVSEGGTFAHNGTTQLVIDDIPASAEGAVYQWVSTQHGRWYYAWRMHNSSGYSNWTDGNEDPSTVAQWVETNTNADTGPPSGWQVSIELGPRENTIIVHATRPITNGNVITGWAVQIKDAATGSWRLLDANAGAAETHYDGSAANHTMAIATGLFGGNGGVDWDTAAVGDMLLMDVRGDGNFNVAYCVAELVEAITASTVKTYKPLQPLPGASQSAGNYDKIRLKIVKPPWNWNSEGYMGGWAPGGGYWDTSWSQFKRFHLPDYTTAEWISDPIAINPTTVTPEARVWFVNGYSINDDAATHSTGVIGGPGIMGPKSWTSFKDRDWWFPVLTDAARSSLTINANGQVVLANTATLDPAYGVGGMVGRFRIYPGEDGIVQVGCSFTCTSLSNGSEKLFGMLLDCGIYADTRWLEGVGGMMGRYYRSLGVDRLSIAHQDGFSPQAGVSGLASYDDATSMRLDMALPALPFTLDMRLTIDESEQITDPWGIRTVWKLYEYQINSGGWNTITPLLGSNNHYDRHAVLVTRGWRPFAGLVTYATINGDNVTLTQFAVIKGICVRT